MNFLRAEPTENFFIRFVSEGGRWEMGFWRVLYGVRVRLGIVGAGTVLVDYCAGDSVLHQMIILAAVKKIMTKADEDIEVEKVRNLFPDYRVKPIWQDLECYTKLLGLAATVELYYPDPEEETLPASG